MPASVRPVRVLIVAGSDSGGGAGIQADIKTVTMLGGYAMTAVTALTAQNTEGVFGVMPVPPDFVARQMRLVLEDIGADVVKLGMLHDAGIIRTVAATIAELAPDLPLVVDPVMVAKGGASLLAEEAVAALRQGLMTARTVLTPNLPEAEVLLNRPIASVEAMMAAARELRDQGVGAVLLKGGHLEGPIVTDVLADGEGIELFTAERIDSRHTHGTGCTLASALSTGLAQGKGLRQAVMDARDYVRGAIAAAPGFGRGHGPLGHNWLLSREE
ncbi:MAG TPA: bifunctional hydroxymethylpyrimidine kinase/phosphomethylpyrimidine kinase [Stellaceae bacterium]|nr:bifunctional hydroxymethylpyrimidine kinase/phosphomethylpyrimidine kinase [Stellaceae bacterium]